MQPARRRDEAPPAPGLPEIITGACQISDRAGADLARAEAVIEAIEQGKPPPDWVTPHQLAMLAAGLRQEGGGMHAFAEQARILAARVAVGDAELACAKAASFQQGVTAAGGRHRAPKKSRLPGKGQLALIMGEGKGTTAVGGIAGVVTLHRLTIIKATLGAAAASVAVASTTGMVHLPAMIPAPSPHAAATSSLPSLAPASAIPITLRPSSEPSYAGRHAKPGAPDAKTATPVPSSPPPVVVLTPPPSPPPPPVPSPQPQVTATGTLDLQTLQVLVGINGTGTIVFSAVGGALEWSASSSSPDLTLDRSDGILGDGQSAVITVSVAHGTLAGAATVTVTAGGQEETIPVTWISIPG